MIHQLAVKIFNLFYAVLLNYIKLFQSNSINISFKPKYSYLYNVYQILYFLSYNAIKILILNMSM